MNIRNTQSASLFEGQVQEFAQKKEGHEKSRALYRCEGNLNLQRGTANAAALGGKPPCALAEGDMVVFWAWRKESQRMTGMQLVHAKSYILCNPLFSNEKARIAHIMVFVES